MSQFISQKFLYIILLCLFIKFCLTRIYSSKSVLQTSLYIILLYIVQNFLFARYLFFHPNILQNNTTEHWRDMAFDSSNYITNDISTPAYLNYSKNNLPPFYQINQTCQNSTHFLNLIIAKIIVNINGQNKLMKFNCAERPIIAKSFDPNKIKILANSIINLINEFADNYIKVAFVKTLNESHYETEEQSKIGFSMVIKMYDRDLEKMGESVSYDKSYFTNKINNIKPKSKYDLVVLDVEFVFVKLVELLDEHTFFDKTTNPKNNYKMFLSKFVIA